jgi:hypothetical protein
MGKKIVTIQGVEVKAPKIPDPLPMTAYSLCGQASPFTVLARCTEQKDHVGRLHIAANDHRVIEIWWEEN